MTSITDLESSRTLSILSEIPQWVNINNSNMVAYAGYVMPYSTFSTIFLWALIGSQLHQSVWMQTDEELHTIENVKKLNPHDLNLQTLTGNDVGFYLTSKFRTMLLRLSQDEIESMIESMYT